MLFDKGKPLSKEFCELCKKEIEPGEKMVLSMTCPTNERQLFNRFNEVSYYWQYDNAPRYHENCFPKIEKKK